MSAVKLPPLDSCTLDEIKAYAEAKAKEWAVDYNLQESKYPFKSGCYEAIIDALLERRDTLKAKLLRLANEEA